MPLPDRVVRPLWVVGILAGVVLIYATGRFRIAFPLAFTLGWALAMFSRRRVMFPEINGYSAEKQDAAPFFGWFILAVLGVAAGAMWLFGGFL